MKPIFPAVLILAVLALPGCGNKGPLVLPTAPAADVPPLDAPADGEPEPEALLEANQQPVEGDASEGGDTAMPPPAEPPPR